jgi:hypothetical protein
MVRGAGNQNDRCKGDVAEILIWMKWEAWRFDFGHPADAWAIG